MRGRKPKPIPLTPRDGGASPAGVMPRCPPHLSPAARNEWRRLAKTLHEMGILTSADRGALAAYCQAWGRWVEAEEQLAKTPMLIKTPSGYVQQSPWLSVSNKQLELMARYMSELGLTPSARGRVAFLGAGGEAVTLRSLLDTAREVGALGAPAPPVITIQRFSSPTEESEPLKPD